MDENTKYLAECFVAEFKEFLKGMFVLIVPVALYWIFVG